jgi:hypothetical protein
MKMSDFEKFQRLSWRDRALILETFVSVSLASAALALLSFRRVALLASRPPSSAPLSSEGTEHFVERLRWAISAVSTRIPWRAVCFQQGLAAHFMLRRRGIASVMYYGAAQSPEAGKLAAHVWVRAGTLDVIGCEEASSYALLTTFPARENEQPRAQSA